jgi:hypothetical protein
MLDDHKPHSMQLDMGTSNAMVKIWNRMMRDGQDGHQVINP